MIRRISMIVVTLSVAAGGAMAQSGNLRPDALLAGMREYPANLRGALLAVAHEPELLKQVADRLSHDGKIEIPDNVGDGLKSAYHELGANPELILFAADQRESLAQVAAIYDHNPQEVERRWDELARGYDQARRDAARVWQKMLEADPMVLRDYISALHQFSTQRREQNADFALVQVLDRGYYYAAPPNDALLAQLDSEQVSPALRTVIERWWHRYGDGAMDTEALRSVRTPLRVSQSDAVVDWSPAERRGMWRPAGLASGKAIGLMPVMLQPLDDQPGEARVAYAIAENMRLWAAPIPGANPSESTGDAIADSAPAVVPPDADIAALPPDAYAGGVEAYSNTIDDIPYTTYTGGSSFSTAPIYGSVPGYVSVPTIYSGDVYGAYPYGYSYSVPSYSVFATFGYGGFCGPPRCFRSHTSYYDYGAFPQRNRDPYGIWGPAFGTNCNNSGRRVSSGIRGPVRVSPSGSSFDRVQPRSVISLDGNRGNRVHQTTIVGRENLNAVSPSTTVVRSPIPANRAPTNPALRNIWPAVTPRTNSTPAAPSLKPTTIRPVQPSQPSGRSASVRPAPPSQVRPAPSAPTRSAPAQHSSSGHGKPVNKRP